MKIKTKRIIKSKRCMTLFEVLIALSLLSVLLAILFGFFRELTILNEDSKKNLKESFQARYAESRLSYVLSNIVNENDTKRTFYFYTMRDDISKFPSLIFTFDNGNVLDPYLAGDVLGRLFVDNDNHLCLAVAPLKSQKGQTEQELQSHIKLEYLLDDVQNITFSFMTPILEKNLEDKAKKEAKDTKESKNPSVGEWLPEWDKGFAQMPVIMKMGVDVSPNSLLKGVNANKSDSKTISKVFSFVLPSSQNPIIFKTKQ